MNADAGLFRRPCTFIAGAANIDALPPITLPEVAFIGRSNVGKSTLVNAVVGQKALARTSQNPGHTQQLNFFNIGDALIIVDMPGYGFAKVSKKQKGDWNRLIRTYLQGRASLQRTFLLIDARRGLMEKDIDFMRMMDETAVNYQIILTKIDTISAKELGSVLQNTEKTIKSHAAAHPVVIQTSSTKRHGLDILQEELLPFAVK